MRTKLPPAARQWKRQLKHVDGGQDICTSKRHEGRNGEHHKKPSQTPGRGLLIGHPLCGVDQEGDHSRPSEAEERSPHANVGSVVAFHSSKSPSPPRAARVSSNPPRRPGCVT